MLGVKGCTPCRGLEVKLNRGRVLGTRVWPLLLVRD
jgi:hypothetical protein